MKKKLGQEPAFPCLEYNEPGYGNTVVLNINGEKNFIPFKEGMSKRFYAACAAMQGILSGDLRKLRSEEKGDPAYPMSLRYNFKKEMLIKNAYEIADELLKQENEKK